MGKETLQELEGKKIVVFEESRFCNTESYNVQHG